MTVQDTYPIPTMDACIDSPERKGPQYPRHELSVLTDPYRTKEPRQNDVHNAHRNLRVYAHAIGSEERTSNVPTGQRHYPDHGEITARLRVHRQHYSLLVEL